MIKKADNHKNVLLVDDDHAITQTLTLFLQTRGYDVNIAHSGQEVFQKVTDSTDFILLDFILPDCGCLEICCKLRENHQTQKIPIIILSAKMLDQNTIDGCCSQADDYLTKSLDCEELVAHMETLMQRGVLKNCQCQQTDGQALTREVREIVEHELITPFFQPIFLLDPCSLFGYEALSRPLVPKTSTFSNPEILFKTALELGFYHDLEMISWRKAVASASKFIDNKRLFLNCNPHLVQNLDFSFIQAIFDRGLVNVDHVTLEITERSAIDDFKAFYEHLIRYREYGFKFAVDDVGGGYAGLEAIVTTRPEIVKIDRHIIHDIEGDPFKRSIIKFIVAFCKDNHILCVAEGIERKEELNILVKLGVDAGQGYYLGRPSNIIDSREITNRAVSLF